MDRDHANLLICGPSGVGKSWLASALGNKACRDNRSVPYRRGPRLFSDLAMACGDGRHPRLLAAPENRDDFRGPANVARVKAWRSHHRGYRRKRRRAGAAILIMPCIARVGRVGGARTA
jgi:IstB-like ATP binding protein